MKTSFSATLLALSSVLSLTVWYPSYAQTDSAAGQLVTGQVLDLKSHAPVPYASLGLLGQAVGTVADEQGRFALALPPAADRDTLRLGLLGYAPIKATVAAFRQQLTAGAGKLYLVPTPTQLAEVVVRPDKLTRRVLGNPNIISSVSLGFKVNEPGNEIAQGMLVRRPSTLEEVSFQVAYCTYDSLFYCVNVYQVVDGQPTTNLLPEPVYLRVRNSRRKDRLTVDLRRFNLTVQGDITVSLEMVKDLGPGALHLSTRLTGGRARHRTSPTPVRKAGGRRRRLPRPSQSTVVLELK